ncbi:MAG: hypothetical protein QGG24_03970 [Vicinamibacterales bacterium]|jgi:aryl sulfotransferase|nr:hypothetical protein [Vicinamibacterales bacterium]MDP7478305.1 hypothetical protein [Vicinamibacterales bacterium]MDP7672369.1 hypothetical protein [Vicinamibacterales bacterium]HJO37936.1 hypothetical protein [Vicinamibacterales bacterium]|tara:strand:+ start:496 stop:657 length:162 start_codon:yes stop_codon:yes gene_type:complete
MSDTTTAAPTKTSEFHNNAMDSTRWDGFAFRDDDIVVGTWARWLATGELGHES